jgi:hypothetical protein
VKIITLIVVVVERMCQARVIYQMRHTQLKEYGAFAILSDVELAYGAYHR